LYRIAKDDVPLSRGHEPERAIVVRYTNRKGGFHFLSCAVVGAPTGKTFPLLYIALVEQR
ncbi:MAG: hypothetical protein IJZ40_03800, partial [Bacteroidaceae bacterium]|nr:hypothetical protein [Bacteroidaceae bacterium]